MLQSMGWQRVGHDLAAEQQQKKLCYLLPKENARRPCGVSSELVINFRLVPGANTNILTPVNPPGAGGHSQ